MNILFDLISLQDDYINGGAEYTRSVLDAIIKNKKVILFGLIDQTRSIPIYLQQYIDKIFLDIFDIKSDLKNIIHANKIDKLYISIAQRYARFNLSNLPCKIILTIHDIGDLSQLYDNNINSKKRYLFEKQHVCSPSFMAQLRITAQRVYHKITKEKTVKNAYKNLSDLIQNQNVEIVTVSEYTKYAILYFFKNITNEIRVFSPPHKIVETKDYIENTVLLNLIKKSQEFFLLLNCDRRNKNAALFLEQWDKFSEITQYKYYAVFIGKNLHINHKNIITIDSLSDSDLENAMKNAFSLVYPSISEGYGYPPMEAMKYGTPVICSNVTSLNDLYKDCTISFSPYYPEDLFKACLTLIKNRNKYVASALQKFAELNQQQSSDFNELIKYIVF